MNNKEIKKQYKILFVCLGNICRSSAAEEVMRQKLINHGLENAVMVDSAGLIDFHEGEMPDSRMIYHSRQRGYNLTHRSRPVNSHDFKNFDMIIGMDESNIKRLRLIASNSEELLKIHKMTEYNNEYDVENIPDPYYGNDKGFERVLDLLEDACEGLIEELKEVYTKFIG